jgi:putative two-component system response regulator
MARILVVDDEDAVRQVFRRILERGRHTVLEGGGVTRALELLACDSFDVVLCDVSMPDGSGMDLARHVTTNLEDTAIVLISGIDDLSIAGDAIAVGAYTYLVKPVTANELLINVSSALRRRDLERERRLYVEELEAKVLARTAALQQAVRRLDVSEAASRGAEREIVERLVTALTLRSEETGGHIQRVGRYAALLANRRGVPGDLQVAAMLHDVGKLGVPDSILLKPGHLTDDEFSIIKRHSRLGHDLLAGGHTSVLVLGARIALSHHERWDGTGYPNGLAGEAIPIEGRIVAAADVFDALTSDRVYRAAMSPEQAAEVMLDGRGRQFDPDIVDTLVQSIDDLLRIREAFSDAVVW